jgi:hypothetical protein
VAAGKIARQILQLCGSLIVKVTYRHWNLGGLDKCDNGNESQNVRPAAAGIFCSQMLHKYLYSRCSPSLHTFSSRATECHEKCKDVGNNV